MSQFFTNYYWSAVALSSLGAITASIILGKAIAFVIVKILLIGFRNEINEIITARERGERKNEERL